MQSTRGVNLSKRFFKGDKKTEEMGLIYTTIDIYIYYTHIYIYIPIIYTCRYYDTFKNVSCQKHSVDIGGIRSQG